MIRWRWPWQTWVALVGILAVIAVVIIGAQDIYNVARPGKGTNHARTHQSTPGGQAAPGEGVVPSNPSGGSPPGPAGGGATEPGAPPIIDVPDLPPVGPVGPPKVCLPGVIC